MVDNNHLEESISRIYHAFYLDVYRFLICFSGNQNDAEDMTQEVFIRVLKSIKNYNQQMNLKTWVFSIAKHVAVDHHRKQKLTSLFAIKYFHNSEHKVVEPIEVLEKDELKQVIHDAISKLKPHFRMIVILRGINEISIKETSSILGCSESKVKVDYHRALKELKRKMHVNVEEVLGNA